jgi:hypothetical protein
MTINQNTKLLALTMNPPIIIKTRTKANKNLDLDLNRNKKFEDIKGVIRSHNMKKDRQFSDQRKKSTIRRTMVDKNYTKN